MQKLLVASQKGGVGKTTTSINLAAAAALSGSRTLLLDVDPLANISTALNLSEHPQRQALRQAGLDLPGSIINNVVAGLDVLSPYDDGCSDAELDRLLKLIETPAFADCYDTLIVDTPPFLGANPAQLLACSDDFILVMRAEPLAYRTLPAFLELVQRSKQGHEIKFRGILLTLPEGENPGGRWERELRGRLGSRILPFVVPFDESTAQAGLFGQIVSESNPDSVVSHTYRTLVETMALALPGRRQGERLTGLAALQLASTSLHPGSSGKSRVRTAAPSAHVETVVQPEPEPEDEQLEIYVPSRRQRTPAAEIPIVRKQPAQEPISTPVESKPRTPKVTTPPTAQDTSAMDSPIILGLVFVALAIVLGVGLRFLKLPDFIAPILVGLGVGAVVAVLARVAFQQENSKPSEQPKPPSGPSSTRPTRASGLHRRMKPSARKLND